MAMEAAGRASSPAGDSGRRSGFGSPPSWEPSAWASHGCCSVASLGRSCSPPQHRCSSSDPDESGSRRGTLPTSPHCPCRQRCSDLANGAAGISACSSFRTMEIRCAGADDWDLKSVESCSVARQQHPLQVESSASDPIGGIRRQASPLADGGLAASPERGAIELVEQPTCRAGGRDVQQHAVCNAT